MRTLLRRIKRLEITTKREEKEKVRILNWITGIIIIEKITNPLKIELEDRIEWVE